MVSPFFKFVLTALILRTSNAAQIKEWNKDNVKTDDVTNPDVGETYFSVVYTSIDKVDTNGGVAWKDEAGNVQSPGMKVVTDGTGGVKDGSCIMTSGFNPDSENPPEEKQCNDPQQTSKRAKVYTSNLSGAVDLVFNLEDSQPIDSTYRFYLKYENLSQSRIKSFKIQLGKGIGQEFIQSTSGDAIAFTNREGTETLTQTNIQLYSDNDLATVFAFGLFGDSSTSWHPIDGYYDPTARGMFTMEVLSEDEIQASEVSPNVASLYGDAMQSWINKDIAPLGYFYDLDENPNTEAVLVADFDATTTWGWETRRLCSDPVTVQMIDRDRLNQVECRQDPSDPPVPLSSETLGKWDAPLFSKGLIEDFGNVNVNAHIQIGSSYDFSTSGDTFTIRLLPQEDPVDPGSPWNVDRTAGIGGDPHFKRWGQARESFHGECDLVMMHGNNFHNKAGFDLHVRTTIDTYYSYVESGAFRVGNDIIEMERNHFFVNGVQKTKDDLPYTFGSDEFRYTIHHEKDDGQTQVYRVDLSDESYLLFKFFKQYLTISTSGSAKDFGDSVGIMGEFHTGDMYDRHGKRMSNFEDFCMEWQVNTKAGDVPLFRTSREPQLPYERCRFPSLPRPSRRKLLRGDRALYEEAQRACAGQSGTDFDLCVNDVIITGEIGIAEVW